MRCFVVDALELAMIKPTYSMDTLITHFDAVYLINLPERVDRLKSAKTEFSRAQWDFGSRQVHIFPACRFEERGTFPSAAVRGCFQSHLECLSDARRAGAETVLIMEDDIALSSSFAEITPRLLNAMSAEAWDIVYFGHDDTGEIPLLRSPLSDLRLRPYTGTVKGAHFYAVRKRVLGRLIEHLKLAMSGVEGDQEFGPMPVDGALNIFRWTNPDVRTLIADPKLGWHRASRSDISPRGFDRIGFLRPVVAALRNLKSVATRT